MPDNQELPVPSSTTPNESNDPNDPNEIQPNATRRDERIQEPPKASSATQVTTDDAGVDGRNTLPQLVYDSEQAYIDDRRQGAGVADDAPLVGLAISGGGVRSATFNLGILQVFATRNILRLADYMSTVSGGGYIGSCVSSLLTTPPVEGEDRRRQTSDPNNESTKHPSWWKCHTLYTNNADPQKYNKPRFDLHQHFPLLLEDQLHHLRRRGDFLMLQQGALRREFMRGLGTVVSGMTCTLLIYLLMMTALAGVFLAFTTFCTHTHLWQSFSVNHWSTLGDGTAPASDPVALEAERNLLTDEVKLVAASRASVPRQWPGLGAALRDFSLHDLNRNQIKFLFLVAGFATAGSIFGGSTAFVLVRGWRFSQRTGETLHDVRERRWLQIFLVCLLSFAFAMFGYFWWSGVKLPRLSGLVVPPLYFGVATLCMTVYVIFISRTRMLWSRRDRSLASAAYGICFLSTVAFVIIDALVLACWHCQTQEGTLTLTSIGSLVIARLTAGAAQGAEEDKQPAGLFGIGLQAILTISVAVFVLATFVLLVELLLDTVHFGFSWSFGGWIVAGVAVALLSTLGVLADYNRIGPHFFYRDRLTETYLQTTARPLGGSPEFTLRGSQIVIRDDSNLLMQDLHSFRDLPNPSPYHIVLCSLNLAGSDDLARKDRKSDHFIFSREFTGSTTTGYMRTKEYRNGQTTLAEAMAISGAAASSGMGFYTSLAQAFAMTVFNIRLGYWLTNPRIHDHQRGSDGNPTVVFPEHTRPPQVWQSESLSNPFMGKVLARFQENWVFWPVYLIREMFALTDTRNALINISDGGHTGDNIGLYPLLQRRCRLIVALDGGAEPRYDFGSLAHAIRQINIDENVDIQVDLSRVRPLKEQDPAAGHFLVAKVTYPIKPAGDSLEPRDGKASDATGWIVLLKLSLTGKNEPAVVRSYADSHKSFPHETTADQFFTDDQFEAYRALGAHIANELLDAVDGNPKGPTNEGPANEGPANEAMGIDAEAIIQWCRNEFEASASSAPS